MPPSTNRQNEVMLGPRGKEDDRATDLAARWLGGSVIASSDRRPSEKKRTFSIRIPPTSNQETTATAVRS